MFAPGSHHCPFPAGQVAGATRRHEPGAPVATITARHLPATWKGRSTMAGFTTRPVIMGPHGVVTSGHYLATAAGFRIMQQGGNAIDAAAAMCFCLNLLEPQSNGIGGEVPTLIYSAQAREVFAISGMGWSPQAFTIDWCRAQGLDLIPGDGYLPAC